MGAWTCPLCWAWLPEAEAAGHLREETAYAPWACALCHLRFADIRHAWLHFHPEFQRHPGQEPQILQELDDEKERRVQSLLATKPELSPLDSKAALADPKARKTPLPVLADKETAVQRAACAACGELLNLGSGEKKWALRRHALLCQGLKPYSCRRCHLRCSRPSDVVKHAASEHPFSVERVVRHDEDREATRRALLACFPDIPTHWTSNHNSGK